MNAARTHESPFFTLRVLLKHESKYNVFAAYCLETGNVVTADTALDAKEMIKELIEDEVSFAIAHKNIRNLLCAPAPMEIWEEWQEAVKANGFETIPLTIAAQEIRLDQNEVETEVKYARAA